MRSVCFASIPSKGCEDQTLDDAPPVLVPSVQLFLHRCKMRRYERHLHRLFPYLISHPQSHSAFVAHLIQSKAYTRFLQPCNSRSQVLPHENHKSCQSKVPRFNIDIRRRFELRGEEFDGMMELVQIREEIRATKERVSDRCDFLERKDYERRM